MKIESNGDEKITVALSTQDMSELDITYDEMDYANIETRRVIWTILDKAKHTLGKAIDTEGRLLIEAAPLDDGGCVLHFTAMPLSDSKSKKRLIMKKDAEPIIFCPFDEDALIDALEILKKHDINLKSKEMYLYNSNYYLIIKPKISFSGIFCHILCEFGNISLSSKTSISEICEYGKLLYGEGSYLKESIAP